MCFHKQLRAIKEFAVTLVVSNHRIGNKQKGNALRMFIIQLLRINCVFWPMEALHWLFHHYSDLLHYRLALLFIPYPG